MRGGKPLGASSWVLLQHLLFANHHWPKNTSDVGSVCIHGKKETAHRVVDRAVAQYGLTQLFSRGPVNDQQRIDAILEKGQRYGVVRSGNRIQGPLQTAFDFQANPEQQERGWRFRLQWDISF